MDPRAEQLKARLRWAAACERLAYALDAPAETISDREVDLETAIRLTMVALQELDAAYKAERGT